MRGHLDPRPFLLRTTEQKGPSPADLEASRVSFVQTVGKLLKEAGEAGNVALSLAALLPGTGVS